MGSVCVMCVRAYVFNIHTETIHFQSRCVAATALSLHYISARTSPGVHIIIIIIIVVVAVDSFFFCMLSFTLLCALYYCRRDGSFFGC